MKYFTYSLLEELNSADEDVSEHAEELWEQACAEYDAHLKSISHMLPESLMNLSAHDATIQSFSADTAGNVYIYITLNSSKTRLHYSGTTSARVLRGRARQRDTWVCDEISLTKEGGICHEILFESGAIIEIKFSNAQAGGTGRFLVEPLFD